MPARKEEDQLLLGTVRKRLTRDDAELALTLVAQGSGESRDALESGVANHGIDALLDHPRLCRALLHHDRGSLASLPLFTYVLVRRTLLDADEADRGIADFVASILLHFGLQRRATRIREHDDSEYDALASLAADADCGDPSRAFLVRAHMGNYALWLAGVFPDRIEARRQRRGGPDLEYFDEMGRRGYLLAAHHRLAAEHGVTAFFERLAERFLTLRVALNRLSDQVFFRERNGVDKLLRQVRDEGRWRA